MPLTKKGEEILANFKKEYGEKGEQYFYAAKNKGTITGVDTAEPPAPPKTKELFGKDMSRGDWRGLIRGLFKFLTEEEQEPEHQEAGDESTETKEHNEGRLSQATREEIGREGSEHRAEMPEGVFLMPEGKKYPVKEERDGAWKYSRNLLLAAAREARMHGHEALATRADEIRAREFGAAGGAKDMAIDAMTRPVGDVHLITKFDAGIAFDRESVRDYDTDGRLHVSMANISKANICPYLGSEIPGAESLGLDPKREYRLLRHPDELRKAASTFNNLPILSKHVPATADDHPSDLVIGSTGTDAEFTPPYLVNSLAFWPRSAIENIENEDQKELSCAYRYRADMTPGVYEGEPYDGVMRDIVGNHVALVPKGRAGPDVVVGDSKEELMTTKLTRRAATAEGAIRVFLKPKLAADAKIDLRPVVVGVTAMNYAAQIPTIVARLDTAVRGKLAADADLKDVSAVLLALDEKEEGEDELEPNSGTPAAKKGEDAEKDDDDEDDEAWDRRAHDAGRRLGRDETEEERENRERAEDAMLCDRRGRDARRKLGRDETSEEEDTRERAHDARRRMGRDETEEEKEKREKKEGEDRARRAKDAARRLGRDETEEERRDREREERAGDRKKARDARRHARDARRAADAPPPFEGRPEVVTKKAMDAALASQRTESDRKIAEAVAEARRREREIQAAKDYVRPTVGDLAMDHDTAEAVYRDGLSVLGVSVEGIHPSAYRALFEAHSQKPTRERQQQQQRIGMDAAGNDDFAQRNPRAAKVLVMG